MILIVEDDVNLGLSLQDALSHWGYTVQPVNGVGAAINMIEDEVPKLIICDILLPDHDGFFLLEYIRSRRKFDETGFVFISALIDTEFVIRGLKAGAQDYIRKPFSIKELDLRVRNVLGQKQFGLPLKPIVKPNVIEPANFENYPDNAEPTEVLLRKLNALLAERLSDKSLSSSKVAKLLGMKEYNLKQFILSHTGYSISQYIKQYKWNRAKDVLISKAGNVYEASDALGFINYNYFITKFRKLFGETPKQYYLRIYSLKSEND